MGLLKAAFVPVPFVNAAVPEPANTVMAPLFTKGIGVGGEIIPVGVVAYTTPVFDTAHPVHTPDAN
jgi:hypothetical protein